MKRLSLFLVTVLIGLSGCIKPDNSNDPASPAGKSGLFIINSGTWNYGNATLSFYDPDEGTVEDEVFWRNNDSKLGDVAHSMTIHGNDGWIVVNNSKVIYCIGLDDFKLKGKVTGFTSPRYIYFVSDKKAYVTELYDNRIAIVDPSSYSITGYVTVDGMDAATGSTEQILAYGDILLINCWSYQKSVIKVDPSTDKVVARLETGIQPCSIALDANNKLWVLTDGGGWDGNPIGYEAPTLSRVNPDTFETELTLSFPLGSFPSRLQTDASGKNLYFLNGGVCRMSVSATALPAEPIIPGYYYSMTVSPYDSDIYVGDPIDYVQNGKVYRYGQDAKEKDSFSVGIIPENYCWM